MKNLLKAHCLILSLSVLFLAACGTVKPEAELEAPKQYPKAEREFRAAWVATVANINWPSEKGLSTATQQKEAIELLDLLKELNFNAVIFQVRPQCDALYKSELEPWSYYLTGEQGKAPDPYYDPLEFWINAAHDRGIELHVWLNPYRAHHVVGGPISEHSIVKKKPELVVNLSSGYWWMDPSQKGTQDHSVAVVMDIVKRYDIDGVHFDDYFYPYPSYNDNLDFPDQKSWERYLASGGNMSRSDWRRNSVNIFIKRLYGEIKAEKPHVKFGLSPFGIWRPGHPESIKGFDQHEKLYADARLWLNEGWIDYFTPQLYWPINRYNQSYPVLLGWWESENTKGRHLWPGISLGRTPSEKVTDEAINQIMISRGMLSKDPGIVHWSIGPLKNDSDLANGILEGPYKKQALVPPSPWLDAIPPKSPEVKTTTIKKKLRVNWSHPEPEDVARWVVYYKYGKDWEYKVLSHQERLLDLDFFEIDESVIKEKGLENLKDTKVLLTPINEIALSAVDRLGNESRPKELKIPLPSDRLAPKLEEIIARYPSPKEAIITVEAEQTVKLGIEVLVEDHLELIKGKKIGLITNPSAVDSKLRSDIDILANTPGVNLVALFGTEHGVRGAKQGKIFQDGQVDPETGIPVYSMYGDSYAPKKEWLEKLDVLIFDIQGVGASWYTFKFSMSWAMEACAKAGIPFIVLDRPNPLGGEVVEGPYLELPNIYRHTLPIRHGMTYGELAKMWNETENYGAKLTVIKMKGWKRNMTWDDTGLHWVMPSPNMGTLETAIVYPGQCLFENTNIAEGRGTTKPFLMTGAPWIDSEAAAKDLNSRDIEGAIFRPVYFIPKGGGKGYRKNKPWNEMCGGVEIMLTDYKNFRSVEAALHLIDAYRKTSPESLNWWPPEIIKLLDQPDMTVEKVIDKCQEEIEEFLKLREGYLLYD